MKSVICGVQYFGILLIYNAGRYSLCWAPNGNHQSFWIGETALIAVHKLPVPRVNFKRYIKTLNSVPYSCEYKVERTQRALPLAAKHDWPREASVLHIHFWLSLQPQPLPLSLETTSVIRTRGTQGISINSLSAIIFFWKHIFLSVDLSWDSG